MIRFFLICNTLLFILINNSFAQNLNTDSIQQSISNKNRFAMGLYTDYVLKDNLIYNSTQNFEQKYNAQRGEREFFDFKRFHFQPILVFKYHNLSISYFGFRLGIPNTEGYSNVYETKIKKIKCKSLFFKTDFIAKERKSKIGLLNFFSFKISYSKDSAMLNSSTTLNYQTKGQQYIFNSQNYTLAYSPDCKVEYKRSLIQIGFEIYLFSYSKYSTIYTDYFDVVSSPSKSYIHTETKNYRELLTPFNFQKSGNLLFNVHVIYAFRLLP
ncbi:MAG: hypothetical protein RJA07_2597 [Bacteroidota bacterium]|jgi:hypothetical protein